VVERIVCLKPLGSRKMKAQRDERVASANRWQFGSVAHDDVKAFLSLVTSRRWLSVLLVTQVVLGSGCTSALWENETFAHHYRPARSSNVHLFYSKKRRDILVQYDESKDGDTKTRPRCYWLEPNTLRVNRERKPHFVSARATKGLTAIALGEVAAQPTEPWTTELYAVVRRGDDFFTLYSGKEQIESCKPPVYIGVSRRTKQVILTPFAVAADATLIGAVIGYLSAPQILTALSH